ncbi:BMP family ABC transporter substrate-binding protein [Leptolyngbya sp. 'hensonii']|uniref:BMP family protein n=1 Tax=Leptolyngbya sp. 'hensonii' TaxID=1922337 RepID=UPI00094FBFBA|nr:BMP family protein [Leptolyngbya sp. 'hensonii']OLP19109.1 BMP family ABC transporter substrate-binding protein [Leptolyngbya sp. 'hensonii']
MAGQPSRRQFLLYSSMALGSTVLLKACTTNPPPASESGSDPTSSSGPAGTFKAAIVLPGIISDKAWNQAGYEGLNVVKSNLGAEVAYVEKVDQADQAEALSDFARRGFNVVFAHGGQFDAATQQVAGQFPNTFFVVVNGAATGSNIASLRLNSMELGYLCGVIGASLTKSNQMAYLAGQEFEATRNEFRGFELGARSIQPNIKVSATFTGDWNDAATAKEAFLALISAGADVVYQWLDNAAPVVLQSAADKGVYVFGNTADQFDVAPKAVLTSAIKRIDLAIAYMAELVRSQEIKGEVYTIGLEKPEIVRLGKLNPVISPALAQKVTQVKAAIVAKTLTFAKCQEGGKDTYCMKGKA